MPDIRVIKMINKLFTKLEKANYKNTFDGIFISIIDHTLCFSFVVNRGARIYRFGDIY